MTRQLSFDDIISRHAERSTLQPDWDRQRASAQYIASQFDAGFDTMLLADEVGMGKTYVALGVIADHILQSIDNDRKVLLIVPPSPVLKVKWEQEILSFNDKYLTERGRAKGLRPVAIDSYWDLFRNLHNYDDRKDIYRVDEAERNCFIYCLFEWARSRGKIGKRPSRWPVIQGFDEQGPTFFQFCSNFSNHALMRFLDKEYASQSHALDQLFDELARDDFAAWKIANLLKSFAGQQDRFEPNVFIMGMNALNRPKIHQHENKLLTQYLVGFLLAGRWEATRTHYIKGLEKANVLPEKGNGLWGKYVERMSALSRIDFYGLKKVTAAVANTQDVCARWDALWHDVEAGNASTIQGFFSDLADRVFRAKLAEAKIGLAVVDEVHNWKNGKLGAKAFQKNFAPSIATKLVMSATPFQIAEGEMQRLFDLVQHPEQHSAEVVRDIFRDGGLVARCLTASVTFAKAWKTLSGSAAESSRFPEFFGQTKIEELPDLVARILEDYSCGEGLKAFAKALVAYRDSVNQLQNQLRLILVRHTKSRHKRDFHVGRDFGVRHANGRTRNALYTNRGYANEGDALVNFIGMRLDQVLRRELDGSYEANARLLGGITSSTAAFRESAGFKKWKNGGNAEVISYLDLFNRILDSRIHPKVAATVERAYANFLEGRKTLIFCERTATLTEIEALLDARIKAYLAQQSSDEALKRETLLKNTAFVDNLWWVSLGAAVPDRTEWERLNDRHLDAARQFVRDKLQLAKVISTPRRIIRLLDLYLLSRAAQDGLFRHKPFEKAGELFHELFLHITGSTVETDGCKALRAYLNLGTGAALARIEERTDDDAAEDVDAVIQNQYVGRHNLWCVEDKDFHLLLWQLLGDEAATLSEFNGSEPAQAALSFADVLSDLMEGLRKIVLRPDLIGRYATYGTSDKKLDRVREGFGTMALGHGETMLGRTKRFLAALIEHNGTINHAALHNSKRKNLWQGVFLRDVQCVEPLWGNTDGGRRVALCAAFNSPLLPDILVCSAIGSEGIDLHRYCADIIHHDMPWNPAKLEQRIGRIDRVNSLADSSNELLINIGIPFLEHNYERFQYDVVFSRAQKFEVLMGRPDYDAGDPDEEDFTGSDPEVRESQDAAVGKESEILLALPDTVIDYLRIDLAAVRHS